MKRIFFILFIFSVLLQGKTSHTEYTKNFLKSVNQNKKISKNFFIKNLYQPLNPETKLEETVIARVQKNKLGEAVIKVILLPKVLNLSNKVDFKGIFRNKDEMLKQFKYFYLMGRTQRIYKMLIILLLTWFILFFFTDIEPPDKNMPIASSNLIIGNDKKQKRKEMFSYIQKSLFIVASALVVVLFLIPYLYNFKVVKIKSFYNDLPSTLFESFQETNSSFPFLQLLITGYSYPKKIEKSFIKEYYILPMNIVSELKQLKNEKVFTNLQKVLYSKKCVALIFKDAEPYLHTINIYKANLGKCTVNDIQKNYLSYPFESHTDYYIKILYR